MRKDFKFLIKLIYDIFYNFKVNLVISKFIKTNLFDRSKMSKVQLKIWMAHGTKKIRDAPQTMEAFNTLVDANVIDKKAERRIWY